MVYTQVAKFCEIIIIELHIIPKDYYNTLIFFRMFSYGDINTTTQMEIV
jgi:hypothetical protein